jgi:uncharacterized RDD family membrane protein YckC
MKGHFQRMGARMENQDLRYAPPKARVEDVGAEPVSGELAPRLTRLWAVLVDGVIPLVLMVVISLVTPLDVWGRHHKPDFQEMLLRTVLGFVLFLALHGYLLATRGQTIGKALFNIRIARPDGAAPSFARLAGLRYGVMALLTLIPYAGSLIGLADGLLIFRQSRRCLHDLIADTVVVRV